MAWWVPAIMAGMGALKGLKEEDQQIDQMKMNAMQQRFAPLFGQAPGAHQGFQSGQAAQKGIAGALGGMQTSMNYDMMKNAMNQAAAPGGGAGLVAMNSRPDYNPYATGQKTAGAWIGNPDDDGGSYA